MELLLGAPRGARSSARRRSRPCPCRLDGVGLASVTARLVSGSASTAGPEGLRRATAGSGAAVALVGSIRGKARW